jgi:hypothetical protein
MSESSTIYVGLDQHKESIAVAYVGEDRTLEPIYLGPVGTRGSDVDAMVAGCNPRARSSSLPTRPGRAELQLAEHVKSWRLSPVVEALQALRGVRFTVAVTTIAELGDLTRFAKPRQLMSFLGLHPSEYSTEEKRRLGGIAKTSNGHARRALVEGAQPSSVLAPPLLDP